MSGHSHFATIKHKKAAADAQRGKEFSKLAKEITIVARDGGGDPAANSNLRMVIEKARSINMPMVNVERAIKKGTGEEAGDQLEEIMVEAYGPGGIALLVSGITDNINRSMGEIKQALSKNQGKLVGEGAINWMFERKGVITIPTEGKDKDELELAVIEAGAEDINWLPDGFLEIYTKPTELAQVQKTLESQGLKSESASLDWVAKETVTVDEKDKEAALKLFEALDDEEPVQEIYSNLAD